MKLLCDGCGEKGKDEGWLGWWEMVPTHKSFPLVEELEHQYMKLSVNKIHKLP